MLAFAIVLAFALGLGIGGVAGYAHGARTHVEVEVEGEGVVVQTFVDCKLAYHDHLTGGPRRVHDLGWLDRGAIVTFQVRALKHPRFVGVTFVHGPKRVVAVMRGARGHAVTIATNRVAIVESWTVEGHGLGERGCQADSERRLPFAAATGGDWRRGTWLFGEATALVGYVPLILAVIGALVLAGGALADRLHEGGARRGIVARASFASATLVVTILLAIAANNHSVAFYVAAVFGALSLLAAVLWLLADDLRRLALASGRPLKKDPPGDGDARRVEGGEGATTAGGI